MQKFIKDKKLSHVMSCHVMSCHLLSFLPFAIYGVNHACNCLLKIQSLSDLSLFSYLILSFFSSYFYHRILFSVLFSYPIHLIFLSLC